MQAMKNIASTANKNLNVKEYARMKYLLNITLRSKILAIVLALTLPIAYLSYLYVTEHKDILDAKKMELVGLDYQDQLRPLLKSIAIHRGLTASFLGGDESLKEKLKSAADQIDNDIASLIEFDKVWQEVFLTIAVLNDFLMAWEALKSENLTLRKRENFDKHSSLIRSIQKYLNYIAYESGLNNDPDRVTSYLVKLTTADLPNMLEQLRKLRELTSAIATRQYLEDGENSIVMTYEANAKNALDAFNDTLQGVFIISPEVNDLFVEKLEIFDKSVVSYQEKISKLMDDVMVLMSADGKEYFAEGTNAIDLGFDFYADALDKIRSNLLISIDASLAGLYTVCAIAMALFIFAVILSYFVLTDLSKNFNKITGLFKNIQNGKYDNIIESHGKTEIADIFSGLSSMQAGLKKSIESDQRAARENGRIKQALDNVTSSVMVTNSEDIIIYLNEAGMNMFSRAQTDIANQIKGFNANSIVGQNLAEFFKQANNGQPLISNPNQVSISTVSVGGHALQVTSGPILDDSSNNIGMVLEWKNRTQELAIESEVEDLVKSALKGDLSNRIAMKGKEGFYEFLSQGINDLVDVSERVIIDTIRVLSAMARGDLTQRIDAEYYGAFDKLKSDANETIDKLTDIVSRIKESSGLVNEASSEISQGNLNLSNRTESQASSLEETSASMTEMTSTVQNNAENAKQAKILANNSRQQAETGGEVVSQAVAAMDKINSASNKIANIIGVIDEIAFQTNLLALNAAVEAARAGEQGRGFAVVATEVRNLAGRSATAAKEIKDLIEDSVVKVKEGAKLVNQSGDTLNQITNSIKEVDDIIGDITVASQEQSTGIEQANKAILEMDSTTQQNAALVEEISASAESMNEQSNELNNLVEFFVVSNNTHSSNGAFVDRRSGERPWSSASNTDGSIKKSQGSQLSKAVGDNVVNDDWEEF
jgi:methyl-accepting chemotaxis protein